MKVENYGFFFKNAQSAINFYNTLVEEYLSRWDGQVNDENELFPRIHFDGDYFGDDYYVVASEVYAWVYDKEALKDELCELWSSECDFISLEDGTIIDNPHK